MRIKLTPCLVVLILLTPLAFTQAPVAPIHDAHGGLGFLKNLSGYSISGTLHRPDPYISNGLISVLASLTLPNGTSYQFTYNDDVINGCTGFPPLTRSTLQLTSMTMPTGARLDVAYAPNGVPNGGEYSRYYDLLLAHMVGSVTLNPGQGTPQVTSYAYWFGGDENVTQTTETRPDGSKRTVSWNLAGSAYPYLRNSLGSGKSS